MPRAVALHGLGQNIEPASIDDSNGTQSVDCRAGDYHAFRGIRHQLVFNQVWQCGFEFRCGQRRHLNAQQRHIAGREQQHHALHFGNRVGKFGQRRAAFAFNGVALRRYGKSARQCDPVRRMIGSSFGR